MEIIIAIISKNSEILMTFSLRTKVLILRPRQFFVLPQMWCLLEMSFSVIDTSISWELMHDSLRLNQCVIKLLFASFNCTSCSLTFILLFCMCRINPIGGEASCTDDLYASYEGWGCCRWINMSFWHHFANVNKRAVMTAVNCSTLALWWTHYHNNK